MLCSRISTRTRCNWCFTWSNVMLLILMILSRANESRAIMNETFRDIPIENYFDRYLFNQSWLKFLLLFRVFGSYCYLFTLYQVSFISWSLDFHQICKQCWFHSIFLKFEHTCLQSHSLRKFSCGTKNFHTQLSV